MNPLTNIKNIKQLSEQDLKRGSSKSWHDMYKDSAWLYIGGLPYNLSEGDVIAVFSQYGEVVNINLIRDKASGKSRGFCFVCYEDQRSTILAVDNLNGIKILNRTLRVDHVANYVPPRENDHIDETTLELYLKGCAPLVKHEMSSRAKSSEDSEKHAKHKTKKSKKEKKHKKEKKGKKRK